MSIYTNHSYSVCFKVICFTTTLSWVEFETLSQVDFAVLCFVSLIRGWGTSDSWSTALYSAKDSLNTLHKTYHDSKFQHKTGRVSLPWCKTFHWRKLNTSLPHCGCNGSFSGKLYEVTWRNKCSYGLGRWLSRRSACLANRRMWDQLS